LRQRKSSRRWRRSNPAIATSRSVDTQANPQPAAASPRLLLNSSDVVLLKLDDQRPKQILALDEMQAVIASADSEQYRCLLRLRSLGG
jgi:hypothetical protein